MNNTHLIIGFICIITVMSYAAPAGFSNEKVRVSRAKTFSEKFKKEKNLAIQWAKKYNQKTRIEIEGTTLELMKVKNNVPIFYKTCNHNAAISTAADLVRNVAPYNLNGTNMIAGVWDAGSVLSTHQEFNGRVAVKDGADSHYHSTHVGGTIAARGVVANAEGMAPEIKIDSYDWDNDNSEMTSRAASAPNQLDKIYISNHSYGIGAGWVWGAGGNAAWYWLYDKSVMADKNFGRYSTEARDWDDIMYNAPYYLIVKAAGNDRTDGPSNGDTFYYNGFWGWTSDTYDDSVHPLGDGIYYFNGYDTIPVYAIAKNILTVGAVSDAVSGGARSLSAAAMSSFGGWGPADDGRIKPDIVGNGISLYSTLDNADNAYGSLSGTSMATPNICGSAALLIQQFKKIAGQEMRASTLKGVIIHSADDLGRPGPDYSFGWGLMNTKAAADIIDKGLTPSESTTFITENLLDDPNPIDSYLFDIDGTVDFKVTLCWTDPAGTATSTHNDRTPVLVNDLDLRIISPSGVTNYPFVLDVNSPTNVATRGDNIVDNVEQVIIEDGAVAGTYTVIVTKKGSLSSGGQYYSLIATGMIPEPTFILLFTVLNLSIFYRRDFNV